MTVVWLDLRFGRGRECEDLEETLAKSLPKG